MSVTIDSTWLTTNGPAPFTLNADNTVYQLTADVAVTDANLSGEIFILDGENIYLDLNGHTITLNGKTHPQVTDTELAARTSETAIRIDPTRKPVKFGGMTSTGMSQKPIIPPDASYLPLLTPYADSE